MSDYLGNLVAKSLASEQVAVQPRLASRFEPVGPTAPVLLEETVERIAIPNLSPAPVVEPSFPSPPRRGDQGVRPRREERSEEQATTESPQRVARRGGVPFEASPPLPPSRGTRGERGNKKEVIEVVQREVAVRSALPSEASPPGPLSHRTPPDWERGNVVQPVVAKPEPLHLPVVIPSPTRQDVSVTSPLSPRERGPGGEASRASLPEHRQPPEQPPVLPILQPRVTLPERDPFPVRPEPPAAEPVIHVTIGRIEVRATPAPKAPARERQAARPPVDLEEYLRQRSKGEGR